MLATVCCRFGSWGLVTKLNFCSDFQHKVWSGVWSWSSGEILKLKFGQYFAADVWLRLRSWILVNILTSAHWLTLLLTTRFRQPMTWWEILRGHPRSCSLQPLRQPPTTIISELIPFVDGGRKEQHLALHGNLKFVNRLVFLAIMGTEKTEKLKSMLNVTGSCWEPAATCETRMCQLSCPAWWGK